MKDEVAGAFAIVWGLGRQLLAACLANGRPLCLGRRWWCGVDPGVANHGKGTILNVKTRESLVCDRY